MRAVNLLPADLRGAVKAAAPVNPVPGDSGGPGAFIALGALALCVLAFAGYVVTNNSIAQTQADLDHATAQSDAVLAEVNRLKPYADFQQTASARIATVRDLAGQRFDWERAFGDLARVIPADVSIKKLSGSLSSQSGGSSPLRGAITAPAITLDGCTANQKSVARLLARLDGVSGVTRVSLAKSDKLASDANADAGGGVDATVTGCEGKGKSDPPDFQIVVFFERAAALSVDATAVAVPAAAPAADGAQNGTATPAGGESADSGSGSSTNVSTSEGAPE